MTHDLVITRAHFHCGSLVGPTEIKFTTEDGGELVWNGIVLPWDEPVVVSVPGDGELSIEHCQMSTVSISHKEYLMRTTRMTFNEVAVNPSKSGICPVCGKKATRSAKFFQTLNPFNTNDDGSLKTRAQIYDELAVKVAEWKTKPTFHAKCEG